jgi:hypothetical protein
MENKILIDVETFKAILLYGWHLLPPEKQAALTSIRIYPKFGVTAWRPSTHHRRPVH